ncbi:hypothetical protein SY86_25845 [Erwinia tracheiphila]|uniref:Uncharacterized protein n=1 Tax=Erwinia tracheiphila TaxID=65700 RepID=A0A0M2K3S5_9GAMM|nr:hypothetical protein SY86_25845 [Erwinia tracheiphila]
MISLKVVVTDIRRHILCSYRPALLGHKQQPFMGVVSGNPPKFPIWVRNQQTKVTIIIVTL